MYVIYFSIFLMPRINAYPISSILKRKMILLQNQLNYNLYQTTTLLKAIFQLCNFQLRKKSVATQNKCVYSSRFFKFQIFLALDIYQMVLFDIIIVRFVIVSLFRATISKLIQILKMKILLILNFFTKMLYMDI